uniref:Uncharacterized protein n=1 Tax=Arundo donax TaxID=35708 RepID=A0A0A9AB75_ARUDO
MRRRATNSSSSEMGECANMCRQRVDSVVVRPASLSGKRKRINGRISSGSSLMRS